MTSVAVMSKSAHQCTKVIVGNVHDLPEKHVIMDTLVAEFSKNTKHKSVRKALFEYMGQILEKMTQQSEDTESVLQDADYMQKIEELLGKGISDSDPKTRSQAFTALAFVSFIDEERSKRIMDTMSRAVLKKYQRIRTEIDDKRISSRTDVLAE